MQFLEGAHWAGARCPRARMEMRSLISNPSHILAHGPPHSQHLLSPSAL